MNVAPSVDDKDQALIAHDNGLAGTAGGRGEPHATLPLRDTFGPVEAIGGRKELRAEGIKLAVGKADPIKVIIVGKLSGPAAMTGRRWSERKSRP